jgi:hypothetical protein
LKTEPEKKKEQFYPDANAIGTELTKSQTDTIESWAEQMLAKNEGPGWKMLIEKKSIKHLPDHLLTQLSIVGRGIEMIPVKELRKLRMILNLHLHYIPPI